MTIALERVVLQAALDGLMPKKAKPRRWASPLDMAQELDPTVVRTPALELINQKLVDLADGRESRLMVAVSPQEGKSTLCSKWFPLFMLVNDPTLRVAVISYSDEMARRWGADIKQLVETYNGDDDAVDLDIRLRGDSRAAGRWQIDGQPGGVYCVGIAGSLTGKPVDCLDGDTKVLTRRGAIPIRDLSASVDPVQVLSYNHHSGRTEWKAIAAARAVLNRPVVEVVTLGGRRVRCTADHPIFTLVRGYTKAGELHVGELLSIASDGHVDRDQVAAVRQVAGQVTVYDIQVADNHNFYADGVLVHNCLIIDDPIKDLAAAQSEAYRRRCQDFWQGVAIPRLGPGARALLVQTRWHESDMAGWLLASDGEGDRTKGGRWQVVSIPAQAEDADDPLGRRPGEFMQSARGDRDWEAIRKSVGTYVWASLYQQKPAPTEGGLFKRLWWRRWVSAPVQAAGERIRLGDRLVDLVDAWRFGTIDLANSTRTSADYTVIAAWARTTAGDLVLLDLVRARIGDEQHFVHARPLVERWRLDTLFVEGSQYATTLVREAANSGVPITAIQAEQDKFSRALPASAWASAGRIWIPAVAHWVDAFVTELASFPNGSHDDQCDVLSLACRVAITRWAPMAAAARQARAVRQEPDPLAVVGGYGEASFDNL